MNFDRLNRWLTLSANIAVVLGIIFLMLEVNQSTKATEAAANDSVMNGHLEISLPVIIYPEFAKVFALGLYQPESLTDEQAVQFAMWFRQFVNQNARVLELSRRGLFTESYEGGDIQQLARMLSTPGGQLYFEGNKDVMTQDLLTAMEPYLGQQMKSDFTLGRNWTRQ